MYPDKAQYRPGDQVVLHAPGAAAVLISELGRTFCRLDVVDGQAIWQAPEAGARAARGFRAEALDGDGRVMSTTAFDVAPHWSVAPRYGFLSEFSPADTAAVVDGMNLLHLNVVQYYDWMYTHYQYFADTEEFTDTLNRRLSHRVVRDRIEACHAYGMACLAYGAMYGGEPPFAHEHADWLLYGGDGSPVSAGPFYIQNVSRECGWREHIYGEYEQAITRLGFDGIHIDQYGFPKRAVAHASLGGGVVDMTTAMPDFVAEACDRLRPLVPGGGSIFNCVNNWPVDEVARLTGDAATYIEVWPPHTTYRDLHELIRHARAVGPHKQVILAAYLLPFHPKGARRQPGTAGSDGPMNSLRLATAAIHAAGGFHLLLGEGDAVLTEAYYPTHDHLKPSELATVQQYYDFITAYGELLHDLDLRDVGNTWNGGFGAGDHDYRLGAPTSLAAEPGHVWAIVKEKPGRRVIHMINLCGLEHGRWNEPQPAPQPVAEVEVSLQTFSPIRAVWMASPDDGGAPQRLAVTPAADGSPYVTVRVPDLRFWTMLWTEE